MIQIIIIEDDLNLSKGLSKALADIDRNIICCMNLKSAEEQLLVSNPALIILDINLPDGNGIDFLMKIKMEYPDVSVIMLTANDTDLDIVEGFEKGADDYITKPFSLSVLRARVNNQLKRVVSESNGNKVTYSSKKYSFDFDDMKIISSGKIIELSKTELKLLRILVENEKITIPRETLINKIWTDESEFVYENALSVTVKRLRDKLSASGIIKTVYGIGYKWEE